jgi:hypoxanthine-DNA glycosylase
MKRQEKSAINNKARQVHPFAPVYDSRSCILILGTFPSVKSRENAFYYGHPQNRFWQVTAAVFLCPVPVTVQEKTVFLQDHHIALWDVVSSCDITGSDDSSIRNVIPNDLQILLAKSDISRIFANGKTAERLYCRYSKAAAERNIHLLPSTSPANAAFSLDRLIREWSVIKDHDVLFPENLSGENKTQ